MTIINLCDCTIFGKVKDIFGDGGQRKDGLYEFLNNVVMKPNINGFGNGNGKMLQDLSDIYVLVALPDFPFDKLPNHSIIKNLTVLGYIWLCPYIIKKEGCVACHFIDFVDSRISGLNIGKHMISEYENREGEEFTYLFPAEIISEAAKYWKKYFQKEYHIENKNDLTQMIAEYSLDEKYLRWEELFSEYET